MQSFFFRLIVTRLCFVIACSVIHAALVTRSILGRRLSTRPRWERD
jgi:hypothetical protein